MSLPSDDNSTVEFCVCPNPVFGPDLSWFHEPSCTLPRRFFLAQFIEHTIVAWTAMILLGRKAITEKGRMFRCASWSIAGTMSLWIFALGALVQGGSFEICGLFLTLCLICCSMCAMHLLHLQVSVLKGVDQLIEFQLLTKSLNMTTYGCISCSAVIGVAWVALCRTSNHDHVVFANVCSIVFWNTLYIAQIMYYSSRLIREIEGIRSALAMQEHSSAFAGWAAVTSRISKLKTAITFYYATLIGGLSPMLVLRAVLGTVPYCFIMVFIAIHCPAILSIGIFLLAKGKPRASESPSVASKTDITPVQPPQTPLVTSRDGDIS